MPPPDPRSRLKALIERHGRAATSFQCLGPGLTIWFGDDDDSAVCYASTGGSWVAAGEPICAEGALGPTLHAFAAAAAAQGRRAIFFAVEQRAVDALKGDGRFTWA